MKIRKYGDGERERGNDGRIEKTIKKVTNLFQRSQEQLELAQSKYHVEICKLSKVNEF